MSAAEESRTRPASPKSKRAAAEAPPPGREQARGAQVGRYVVLKAVGQGGMGVVYAAYDPELDRKVALKLLKLEGYRSDPEAGRLHLLREAQAMARVSHPNVCVVFDVGTWADQVFVAMEFIEGPTLSQWLQEEHPWREVLQVFLQAGQGLAAAHEAGLVHRDFKPANVLLGRGGRAYVTDFGLARPASRPEESTQAPEPSPGESGGVVLKSSVTRGFIGTPNYMPPEQYLEQAPDARSDQFSFCAALYWALYKKRPFTPEHMERKAVEGTARSEATGPSLSSSLRSGLSSGFMRARASALGVIQEPPKDSPVPAWVRRAVLRGLSLDPAWRFPSMKELLEELSQEPRRVRRRWALVGAGVGLAGLATLGVVFQRQARVCAGGEQRVAEVWNGSVQGKLKAAFDATGKPYAAESALGATRALEAYARDWVRQYTEACEATRVRGEQTEELLSKRVVCLERRRKDLNALANLFTQADGKVVEKALDAAQALPALQDCQDVETLASQASLPADPALRAEVDRLEAQISEARARQEAGRLKEALELFQKLESPVSRVGWVPLQAELRLGLGRLLAQVGKRDESARMLEQALVDAEAGRSERTKAQALAQLVFVNANQGHAEQAELWARLGNATLGRLGGDPVLSSAIEANLAIGAMRASRYAEAVERFERVRAVYEKQLAPDDLRLVRIAANMGQALVRMGDAARAAEMLKVALQRTQLALGKSHPETARQHYALADALREAGQYPESLEHAQAALALIRAIFGEESDRVADALDSVGMSLIKLRRHDEARQTFQQAVELKTKLVGPADGLLSYSYDGMGQALLGAGRAAEAVEPLRKALSFEGVEPDTLAETGFLLAQALWQAGEREQALEEWQRSREQFVKIDKQRRVADLDAWRQGLPEQPELKSSKAANKGTRKR